MIMSDWYVQYDKTGFDKITMQTSQLTYRTIFRILYQLGQAVAYPIKTDTIGQSGC